MIRMTSSEHARVTFDGRIFRVEVRTFANDRGEPIEREIVRHPGAVLIVPDLGDGRVVMIRNRRDAVEQTLWELPAGKLEPGEEPSDAAGRELIEETGYRAGALVFLGEFYTSPGYSDELMRVFLARDLTAVGQDLEDDESIEVRETPLNEIDAMVRTNDVRDGKTIAGLYQWMLWRSAQAAGGDSSALRAADRSGGGEASS